MIICLYQNYMRFTRYTTLFFIINLKLLIWSDDPVLLNLRLAWVRVSKLAFVTHMYVFTVRGVTLSDTVSVTGTQCCLSASYQLISP